MLLSKYIGRLFLTHCGRVSSIPSGVNGLMMLGVVHEAVVFLLEQLYGSRHCRSYRFRFHKPEETDEPPINPHGSARAEIHHRLGWDLHTHTYILVSVVNSSFNIAYLNIGFNCNRHCEYSESWRVWFLSVVQEVCIWHVQFLGLKTPPASWV